MRGELSRGLLDTNILILWQSIEPAALPEEMATSAVTLAEHEFDPIPFGADAARAFGRLSAAVRETVIPVPRPA